MTRMVSPYRRWGLMNLEVLTTSAQRNWRTVWPSPWSSKGWKAGLMPDQQFLKTNAVCGKGPVQIRMEIRMMRISYIEILFGYPHSDTFSVQFIVGYNFWQQAILCSNSNSDLERILSNRQRLSVHISTDLGEAGWSCWYM